METWDPAAARDPFPDAGSFIAGPYRVVLHSTEGSTYGGARSAYKANKVSPHFTCSYEKGRFEHWQHTGLDRSATALRHAAGTVHTNRLSAIQIEVVAFAAKPKWADGLITGVADLIAWIMEQTGVTPVAPRFKSYPSSYGLHNGIRFSDIDWLTFNGVCGHQHVPHQDHGDPGAIDILALLPAPKNQASTMQEAPVHDIQEAATKTTMLHIGPLDSNGRGHSDWQPGLGRDPVPVALTLLGPSPPDDGYWPDQSNVQLSAQPRGGALRVVVRNGKPGDTVTLYATVA